MPLFLGPGVLDPANLLSSLGLLGVLAGVFAETGLLVGFFLPGDSLLFTAGLFAARPRPVRTTVAATRAGTGRGDRG